MTPFLDHTACGKRLRLTVFVLGALSTALAHGGARTDGTTGAVQTLSGRFTVPQTLGLISGGNLFHSFQNFNINPGESATFTTSTALQNVIARVTGGSVSTINGLLKLDAAGGGTPAFFFINPAGIVFGAGASVEVPGAFHASTADYLKFAGGALLHADPSKGSSFSAAAPEAFGFLGVGRGAITATDQATLVARARQPLSLVAGDIDINNNATVGTDSGDSRLAAVGQSRLEVPLKGELPALSGNLALVNGGKFGILSEAGSDGGQVSISAGTILLDSVDGVSTTGIFNVASGTGQAGGIDLRASGQLSVLNAGQVTLSTVAGATGPMTVRADSVTVDGRGTDTGFFSQAGATSSGAIAFQVANKLAFINGGTITTVTTSGADAASINVSAGSIQMDQATSAGTGIITGTVGGAGSAGRVDVTARGELSIQRGAQIVASTAGAGRAGLVTIDADTVLLDAHGLTQRVTGIFSNAMQGSGDSVGINLTARKTLSISNLAEIGTSTYSAGNGGNVTLRAGDITINGMGSGLALTGITSQAEAGSTGRAGNLDITASGKVTLTGGGGLSSSTGANGNAGFVKLAAANLVIAQGTGTPTGIFSAAGGGTGNAGNIDVNLSQNLSIAQNGQIFTSSISAGNAGRVSIAAGGEIAIASGGQIASDTFSSGNAGSLTVRSDSLTIEQGAGGRTGIFSEAQVGSRGSAGFIDVGVARQLNIASGGAISSSTFGSGAAGSLGIAAETVTIDGSNTATRATGIFSSAEFGSGNAGNVELRASGGIALANGGRIASSTRTSGNAGVVKVSAERLTIDRGATDITGIFSAADDGSGKAGSVEVRVARSMALAQGGVISTSTSTAGDGGLVSVTAGGEVSLLTGGRISSNTYAGGNAGSITVTADSILIDQAAAERTGIFSQALGDSTGNAGRIDVVAVKSIALMNGGVISTSTFSNGTAGSLDIRAASLTIDAQRLETKGTGIFSTAADGSGNAGNVAVNVSGTLSMKDGAIISSSTSTAGNAGQVRVVADQVLIDQTGTTGTGIYSVAGAGTGNAGNIEVLAANKVVIANGGEISSSTASAGAGGSVTVRARSVDLSGQSSIGSQAYAGSSGQTGSVTVAATDGIALSDAVITIQNEATISAARANLTKPTVLAVSAPRITLNNAEITASSSGNIAASNIAINNSDYLYLCGGSAITTAAVTGRGGSIAIQGGGTLLLDHSRITTSVTGADNGDGGPITINAPIMVLNTGFIQANTAVPGARGGDVNINLGTNNSFIIASGRSLVTGGLPLRFDPTRANFNAIQAARPDGVNGDLHIASPQIDLSGTLAGLSTPLIDYGTLGSDLCRIGSGSSLTPVGRGGLPPNDTQRVRPSF